MGRPRKPTVELKLSGQFRHDRHGNSADTLPLRADLVCPFPDDGEARTLWNSVVPELVEVGIVKANDAAALREMCETWALYRAAYSLAVVDPMDPTARNAVVAYGQLFNRLAAHFGLTPSSRAAIKIEKRPATAAVAARQRG